MEEIKNIEKLKKKLNGNMPIYKPQNTEGTAAVLIPLIEKDGEYHLLFEKRASNLKTQPGEICFPGGRIEDGESHVEAAVREACEELLTKKEQIRIIGELDGVMGPSGAPVWPVAGIINDYEGTYSKDETERIITVPLKWFLSNEAEKYETKLVTVPDENFPYDILPGGRQYKWRQKKHTVYVYRCDEAVLWGMTAYITKQFVSQFDDV